MTRAELASDSYRSWELAIQCLREEGVRRGEFKPRNNDERRWAAEGPLPPYRLSSIRSPGE